MSWEPRDPIGFSPCGMAFGAVRKAYKAPARFFADDPTAANQIIWYNVPDDAKVYEDWTVFWPRVDVPVNEVTSPYETEGLGRIVRTFYNGLDEFGFPGDHVHGDSEDFQGLSLRRKYYVGDTPPVAPCPSLLSRIGFTLGLEVLDMDVGCLCCEGVESPASFEVEIIAPDYPAVDGQTWLFEGLEPVDGLCQWGHSEFLDGQLYAFFIQVYRDGDILKRECYWTSESGEAGPDAISPTMPSFDCDTFQFDETMEVWIGLPGVGTDTGTTMRFRTSGGRPMEALNIAFNVGLTVHVRPETLPFGLALGLTVTDPPPPPIETLPIGVELGLTVTDIPPPSVFGIAMGLIVSDP